MPAIDCSDCYLAIEIGDDVRRSLVAYFNRFLEDQLDARGIRAAGEAARDKRDQEAWRLSARVLNEVKSELAGALDETLLVPDPHKRVQTILSDVVAATVAIVERSYIDDDFLGFDAFVARLGRIASEEFRRLD